MLLFSCSVLTLLQPAWAAARQAPLSMRFVGHEHGSGLPSPSPADLPDPETGPASPARAGAFLTTEPPGKPWFCNTRKQDFTGKATDSSLRTKDPLLTGSSPQLGYCAQIQWLEVLGVQVGSFLYALWEF